MADKLSITDLERMRVGEPFFSRKNRVFKVDIDGKICVAKVSGPGRECSIANEYEILCRCRRYGVSVPEPLLQLENAFVMSHVGGDNASEVFDSSFEGAGQMAGDVALDQLANRFASWLYSFHEAFDFGRVRGDSILRNFIDAPEKLVGIDLEESHEGDPIEDLGQVCAYIIATRPMFVDTKFDFARKLTARYEDRIKDDIRSRLPGSVSCALRYYGGFRSDHVLMNEWADKIATWDQF